MRHFRTYYGARPLHLLASIASLTLVAAGFLSFFEPGSDTAGILLWFVGCALGFELVLVPLAWLLDRIALGLGPPRTQRTVSSRARTAYIRAPALLSGLLLLVFLPLIFRLGESDYIAYTGIVPSGYLARWLFATAALFGISALAYAISLGRARRRASQDAAHPNR